MSCIFKYHLKIADEQTLQLPAGCRILDLQFQRGVICLWALVDPAKPSISYRFRIKGTGHDCEDVGQCSYLKTLQEPDRPLVWHIFCDMGDGYV